MQIRPSGNRDGRRGREGGVVGEGQFPSGASRSSGNRGYRAHVRAHRTCARVSLRHTCACTQTRAEGADTHTHIRARETVYT